MPTGRRDAFLEDSHLVGEGRLVSHCGRHAPEQCGDLGTGLREPEDVVDEEQHILVLHIAEVLCHREGREGDAKTRPRRLIHLTEDEGRLVEDARLFHLGDEVVTLTGALPHPGEHGHSTVVLRDALDHLLDEHGLADAGTSEETDLAAEHVGREQVDDLNAGLEELGLGLELVEGRGLAVDRPAVGPLVGRAGLTIEHLADDVEDLALCGVSDGDRDRSAGVAHLLAAHEAVSGLESDGANEVVTEVLGDLERDLVRVLANGDRGLERVVDAGDGIVRKLDVNNGAGDPGDASDSGVLSRGLVSRGCDSHVLLDSPGLLVSASALIS